MIAVKAFLFIGIVLGGLGVVLGAFGAHALQETLDPKMMKTFQTGVQYQFYHALALIGLGLWSAQATDHSPLLAGWAFTLGVVLFSGSLYALALTGIKIFGAITPLGGLSFIIGWAAWAWAVFKIG